MKNITFEEVINKNEGTIKQIENILNSNHMNIKSFGNKNNNMNEIYIGYETLGHENTILYDTTNNTFTVGIEEYKNNNLEFTPTTKINNLNSLKLFFDK